MFVLLDLQTVCRQLGLLPTEPPQYHLTLYQRSDSLALDSVWCHQVRPYITDCANNGFYPGGCAWYRELSVSCQGENPCDSLVTKLASPVPHPAWLVAVWHRIQERGYLTISSSMYTLLIIHPNNNFVYSMQKGVEQILTGVSLGPTLMGSAWTFSVFSTYTLVCTCCSPIPFRAEILFDKTTLPNHPKYGLMLTHITWLNQWDASFEKLLQYVGSISNPCPDCKQFNQIINRSARFEMGKGYAKSESWYA